MTKQEEIRDRLKSFLFGWQDVYDYTEASNLRLERAVESLTELLHSQGVVIKVDGVFPKAGVRGLSKEEAEKQKDIWVTACEHMVLSGYVAVEPLVEE